LKKAKPRQNRRIFFLFFVNFVFILNIIFFKKKELFRLLLKGWRWLSKVLKNEKFLSILSISILIGRILEIITPFIPFFEFFQ